MSWCVRPRPRSTANERRRASLHLSFHPWHDAAVKPYYGACVVLALAALVTLASGARPGTERRRFVPGALFVFFAALAFLVEIPPLRWAACAAAAVAWLVHLALLPSRELDEAPQRTTTRTERVYVAGAFALGAIFLFHDLGGFAGSLMVWEGGIVQGFNTALIEGKPASEFAAKQLAWNSAVLSAGHESLLYGAPTYALMKTFGFSSWTLRLVSAFAALLIIATLYAIGRRFFGAASGTAIAVAAALHTSILFYGRYGTSLAATVLAVVVLLLCAWTFLDDDRSAWWMGAVVGAVSYAATLGYATGRIVVILLLGFTFAVALLRYRHLWPRRLIGLVVLACVVLSVWRLQGHYGVQHSLLEVRGEQFFVFARDPETYQVELGRRPEQIGMSDRIALAQKVVSGTLPQYLVRALPDPNADSVGLFSDEEGLQRLYHAPLVVFLLLGIGRSLRRFYRWPHACLLSWALGVSVAVLLTTGADTHRLAILVIPICIWIGLGLADGARMMAAARVLVLLRHATALALAACLIGALRHQLYQAQPNEPVRAQVVIDAIDRASGPVYIAGSWDTPELGWVLLTMVERLRRSPTSPGQLLDPVLVFAAANEGPVNDADLGRLVRLCGLNTVIFAPAERFRPVVGLLERHRLKVVEEGPDTFRILRTLPDPNDV